MRGTIVLRPDVCQSYMVLILRAHGVLDGASQVFLLSERMLEARALLKESPRTKNSSKNEGGRNPALSESEEIGQAGQSRKN
jgi:hypothetical protein